MRSASCPGALVIDVAEVAALVRGSVRHRTLAALVHVALLNPVFWPEVRRGSERFARELADGLLARGHDVHA